MRPFIAFVTLMTAPCAVAQQTELASISDGFEEYQTFGVDVSDDGQFVVYGAVSRSGWRVELFDRVTKNTSVISPFTEATQGLNPAISGDGSWVVFDPLSSLLPEDVNTFTDIYAVTSGGAGLELVSLPDGPPGSGDANGSSRVPRTSADGDRVVFHCNATNLTSDLLNTMQNAFVRIRSTNSTLLVSSDSAGVAANQDAYDPYISGNGLYVAFQSAADNLVPGDTNENHDIFVKDLATGAIALVSRNSAGEIGAGSSTSPALTADGRYVVFASNATNLTPSGSYQIYRHDRDPDANGIYDEGNGVTERVSRDVFGSAPLENCLSPRISNDAQRVLYYGASQIDQGLQQNRSAFTGAAGAEAFLFDFVTLTTTNVHVDLDGNHADAGCYVINFEPRYLALSADGSTAVYGSSANNLDSNHPDVQGFPSVFAHDVAKNVTEFLGYDKRGSNGFFPEFSVSGGLASGETADFRVRRAPPSALGLVLLGWSSNPVPGLGGTLVPIPPFFVMIFSMDAAGSFTATVPGAGPLVDIYGQWAFIDPGVPFAISNALRITLGP